MTTQYSVQEILNRAFDDTNNLLSVGGASGTWTPVLTFATPGNLSVAYSIQTGGYTKIGDLVYAQFRIATSTFTHTTASGACQVTGLPFAPAAVQEGGSLVWAGITKASYTEVLPRVQTGSLIDFVASGSGQASSTVVAGDMPTTGTVNLEGVVWYKV